MEYKVGTKIRDIKVICENSVSSIEQKVKDAIKDGWEVESVMNGCPGSCPGSCILMADRRLPPGEEIII
jgi:hypothetical protein